MFEWYPNLDLIAPPSLEEELTGAIRLIGTTRPISFERANWRQAIHYTFSAIALGTRVLWDDKKKHLCMYAGGIPVSWLAPTPVKFPIRGGTLDEVLRDAFLAKGHVGLAPLTAGGLPWEIALISDLNAQRVAANAWRANRV